MEQTFEPGQSISIDDIISASEKLGPDVEVKHEKKVTNLKKDAEQQDPYASSTYDDKPSFS